MPEEAASIFCRVSINLVTLNCGVVYGARNRVPFILFLIFYYAQSLRYFDASTQMLVIVYISIQ